MSAMEQKSGKPWSGTNRIPNIKQFVEALDRDKAHRDKHIDAKNEEQQQQSESVTEHHNAPTKKQGKWVHDPVTGHEVMIEDVGQDFMKAVKDPMVRSIQPVDAALTSI